MSNYRIIIYNVELPELDKAIEKATCAYRVKFGNEPKTLTVPPNMIVDAQELIDIKDLPLALDRFFASGGTLQIGE